MAVAHRLGPMTGVFVALIGCGLSRPPALVTEAKIVQRRASVVASDVSARLTALSFDADALHLVIEVEKRPTDHLLLRVVDATGRLRLERRHHPVFLGPNEIDLLLVDDQHRRLPPGRYQLVVIPYGRDGISHGGDQHPFTIPSKSS